MWERHLAANCAAVWEAHRGKMPLPLPVKSLICYETQVKNPGPEGQALDCPWKGIVTKTDKCEVTKVPCILKKSITCSRAKTQRRKENQGHNLGALSRVKTFSKPIAFICFKVLTGEAGNNYGFLGAFASLAAGQHFPLIDFSNVGHASHKFSIISRIP